MKVYDVAGIGFCCLGQTVKIIPGYADIRVWTLFALQRIGDEWSLVWPVKATETHYAGTRAEVEKLLSANERVVA